MIFVECPIQSDFFIKKLEEYEGEVKYTFVEKKGIRLNFSVTGDVEQAYNIAKEYLKSDNFSRSLYYRVGKE